MLGFVRRQGDGLSVPYADVNGVGGHVLSEEDVPEVLRLPVTEPRHGPADRFLNLQRAIESHLTFVGVRHLVVLPVPGVDQETLLWIGLRQSEPVTAVDIGKFEAVAQQASSILSAPESPAVVSERLQRLELTAELLPELLRVLDVRQIFAVLSAISGKALPHDLLALGVMSDDLTELTVYAQTGATGELPFPTKIPTAILRRRRRRGTSTSWTIWTHTHSRPRRRIGR